MRILLTGSDGYLGSLAAPVLADEGHDVVGLDAGFYRNGWLYEPATDQPQVITKDLRHLTADDLAGFDAIVHMAELSNDPLGQLDPTITYRINHEATVRMAEIAKSVGVGRFVYMSSCSVYGVADGVVDETSPVDPQTAYAECKVMVENSLLPMADADFVPTFMRNATAFGASPRQRMDLVVNNLAGHAWVDNEIKMTSDGTPWRPLVHGLDIAKAIACVLAAPDETVAGQIYNVGSDDNNYTVRQVAEIIADEFPGCDLSFGPSGGDNRSYKVDFTKISTTLPGFSCDWDVARGAAQLHRVFESIEFDADDMHGRRYIRLNQLQHLIRTQQLDAELFWVRKHDVSDPGAP